MSLGTNNEHTRAYNRRVVLDILRRDGPLSRPDVASRTGLTLQGASNVVQDLVREGLAVAVGRRSGGRGQPPVEFAVDPAGACSIGVSIERDRIVGMRIDAVGTILQEVERTAEGLSPDLGVATVAELVRQLTSGMTHEERGRLAGTGVALPAVVDERTGQPLRMVSHPSWEGFPMRDELASALGTTVAIANDAILAAMGEQWFGTGHAYDNFFFILLSRGFGSSHFLHGEPSGGIWGVSGRMGHIPVEPGGRYCPSCGETGCLSLYTSMNALLGELAQSGREVRSASDLTALHEEGDAVMRAWIDAAARYLARGLVALENLIASDAILFGGNMPEPILRDLTQSVERLYRDRPVKSATALPQLRTSSAGQKGVALGAATLPFFLRFAPNHRLVLGQAAGSWGRSA